jgi:hypothetical protein
LAGLCYLLEAPERIHCRLIRVVRIQFHMVLTGVPFLPPARKSCQPSRILSETSAIVVEWFTTNKQRKGSTTMLDLNSRILK